MYLIGDQVKYLGDPNFPYKRPLTYEVAEIVELEFPIGRFFLGFRLIRANRTKMKKDLWVMDRHLKFIPDEELI